jgi:pilus assembly protein Flp/PilA
VAAALPWQVRGLRLHQESTMEKSPRTTRDERGASAVEYGLLIAGVAALIALVVYAFGGGVSKLFDGTCDRVAASAGQTTC